MFCREAMAKKSKGKKKSKGGRRSSATPPAATVPPAGSTEPANAPPPTGNAGLLADGWRRLNRLQIALLMGVSADTVSDYTRDGMPVLLKGGSGKESIYDAVDCLTWQRIYDGRKAKASARDAAQAREWTARAELNELKLQREKRLVIDRDPLIRGGRALMQALGSKLRSLPRRLVQLGVVAREHEAAVVELVREVQTEISRWRTLQDLEAEAKSEGGE